MLSKIVKARVKEPELGTVLTKAVCAGCGVRLPRFDGLRVRDKATVACSKQCWETSTGHVWTSEEFDDEPTIP